MDVGGTPQLEAPMLADLYAKLQSRPLWACDDPLAVDPDVFEKALSEMTEAQKRRGFQVAKAAMTVPNFLFYGVPVVMANG